MLYPCSQLRLVWNTQGLTSAHPSEGCPENQRTMDDPHIHLSVNKHWADKLDLSLKTLKLLAQQSVCLGFWFVWLTVMRGTRLQTSPLFWLAELQANGHTQLSIPALGWEDKNISLLKYSTHGLSMAANQTPAHGHHSSKGNIHKLKPIQLVHMNV